jgi:hypothetical protein
VSTRRGTRDTKQAASVGTSAGNKLLGSDLLPKELLPVTPKQPQGGESTA